MNRRSLLINGLKAAGAVALAAAAHPVGVLARVDAPQFIKAEYIATIRRMIKEQGDWWLRSRDRESGKRPAIVYFGKGTPAFEVNRTQRQWRIRYHDLTEVETREFDSYIASISRFTSTTINDKAWRGSDYTLRAWIKNGRKPGWNMSVDSPCVNKTALVTHLLERHRLRTFRLPF